MKLSKLIDKGLTLAFDTVDELLLTVTFHTKDISGFDYSTKEVIEENPQDVTVKAVVIDSKKAGESTLYKNLLVKSAPLANLDMYDTVTINGQVWTIGLPIVDNGHTQLLEIYKGL